MANNSSEQAAIVSNEEYDSVSIDVVQNAASNVILAVTCKYGKLSAAYYAMDEKVLYSYMSIVDLPPKFFGMQNLVRELQPKHIITTGSYSDEFVNILIDAMSNTYVPSQTEDCLRHIPNNMTLLDAKEYSYIACANRVKTLKLTSEPEEIEDSNRLTYIASLVNLESTASNHMLGALVKFLENAWRILKRHDSDELSFLHLQQLSMRNHVYIDDMTFKSLNVFNQMQHESSFKHGGQTSTREGGSLYKLLGQHCCSRQGLIHLKNLLVTPTNDIQELNNRYEFMDFVIDPRNQTVVENITECIRKLVMISKILNKIQHSQANIGHWRSLYRTIYAILGINEHIKDHVEKSAIFREFRDKLTDNLFLLESCIDSSLDFERVSWRSRPTIKEGLDSALDESKARYETIKSRLMAVARTVVNQFPEHLEECVVFYVPDMGHVISVKKWAPNCNPNYLNKYGCHFLFELHDIYHYKNALCQQLDAQVGNLPNEIQDHENRIIQRIAKYVVSEMTHILTPLHYIAHMDALMSMAKVGVDRHYIRPTFNNENIIDIQNGRHPLTEILDSNYIPNSFASGTPHSMLKIITGPNASGKSLYLKQTSLLVYLAHIGSYLPATAANISPVNSIHTRLHATESASLTMSAFVIDLTQMANALYNAKRSSFVIMDEFGRGTTAFTSKTLLLAALRKFIKRPEDCPHVIVSTHLRLEEHLLGSSPLIQYQMMNYIRDEKTQNLTFLYKVIDGESSSCAYELALSVLNPEIIARAKDFRHVLDEGDANDYNVEFYENINMPSFD